MFYDFFFSYRVVLVTSLWPFDIVTVSGNFVCVHFLLGLGFFLKKNHTSSPFSNLVMKFVDYPTWIKMKIEKLEVAQWQNAW